MSGTKVISSGKMKPVRGGSGHMFGKQTVGTKKAGVTGKADSGGGGKWSKGGPTGKIGGKQPKAGKAVAGRVSVSKSS
jgi:hypothetical protein